MSVHTWRCQGPCKPSSFATFTPNSDGGRAAKAKKSLVSVCAGLLRSNSVALQTMACQVSMSEGFFKQEYWSVLASTGAMPF